jgi:hypothetical protein
MCARYVVNFFLSHPLIFSCIKEIKWDEKIFYQEKGYEGVKVGIWGM